MTIEIDEKILVGEIRRALTETGFDSRASAVQRAMKRVADNLGPEMDAQITGIVRGLFGSEEWAAKLTTAIDEALVAAVRGKIDATVKSIPREELRPLLKGMMGGMKL